MKYLFMIKTGKASIYKYLIATCAILIFLILMPLQIPAQPNQANLGMTMKNLKVKFKLTDRQLSQLRPVIERQAGSLYKILNKYRDKNDASFSPFWADTEIWLDLQGIRQEFDENLSKSERDALRTAFTTMEKEILLTLLDEQMMDLGEELECDSYQVENIHKIVAGNIKKNQLLMNSPQRSVDAFKQKLEVNSNQTEIKIGGVLLPDQFKKYRKSKQKSEKNGINLWGVVPSTGDVPQTFDVNRAKPAPSPSASPDSTPKKVKRGEFVVAPIPIINPTLGNGLAVAAGYLYRLNKNDNISPPSATGLAVMRTSNGSWGIAGGQLLHLKEDRFRLTFAAMYGSVNVKFYGIGQNTGNAGISIPITQKGYGFMVDGLARIRGRWYAGLRYSFMKTKVSINVERDDDDTGNDGDERPEIPELDLNLRTAALGPHILYDSRDDQMYPTRGAQFDLKALFSGSAIGGKRTYQTYDISYAKYFKLAPKQVLAARAAGCFSRGNAPFYSLCLLAQSQNLRGYDASRYRDRNMLVGQAEYRLELPYRFGFVAFAGAGEVANKFSDFRSDKILPGAGVGLRFRLTKQNKVNLRVDYAVGKGSHALYISVGEAF